MTEENNLSSLVDFVHNATSVLKYGFSGNVTVGPYLLGLTVEPTRPPRSTVLPWVIAGGLGLVVLLLVMGD